MAFTFKAFARPEMDLKKSVMMPLGIASLVLLLTGWGMLGIGKMGVPGWALVKTVLMPVFTVLAGMAFRRRLPESKLIGLAALTLVVILWLVLFKPF